MRSTKDGFSEAQLKLREDGGVFEESDYAVYQKLLTLADNAKQNNNNNVNNQ